MQWIGRGGVFRVYSFALAPILTLPIGSGFPLLFGQILDSLAFMGADAYSLFFGCSALFILATLYFTFRTDYQGTATGGKG